MFSLWPSRIYGKWLLYSGVTNRSSPYGPSANHFSSMKREENSKNAIHVGERNFIEFSQIINRIILCTNSYLPSMLISFCTNRFLKKILISLGRHEVNITPASSFCPLWLLIFFHAINLYHLARNLKSTCTKRYNHLGEENSPSRPKADAGVMFTCRQSPRKIYNPWYKLILV